MDTLESRVNYLIKINNLSVAAAAKKCDIPQSRLNDIATGVTKNPHSKTISKIAVGFGAREAWLALGEGEVFAADGAHEDPRVEESAAAYRKQITHNDKPLTARETNELDMLRWLEDNAPDLRQDLTNEITEVFIRANRNK